ncbi:MAG: 5-formyltetrahydrofolate cyclo-ligase [Bacteroidaceae bacterium]|nr:5-formyltetrahydrofolate cyclo-ligase [Bacteroidaceae bacterium]
MDKTALRRHIRALIRQQSPEALKAWSQQLAVALEAHPWFSKARSVMLFAALPDEPQTHSLLQRHARAKHLFLPAVVGDEIEVRRFRSAQDLRRGAFGIEEPVGEPLARLAEIDLIVVPGVAFDSEGRRLGRGKGYYDRLLASPDLRARLLGYAFPFQIVDRVPVDEHDVRMHGVVRV